MTRRILIVIFLLGAIASNGYAQNLPTKFGKGINVVGKDSSFTMKFGIRFQTLYINDWNVRNDDLGLVEDHTSNFLIRRSRFKFNGYAFTPKLKYKMEFGLTNRDMGGGINAEHGYSPRFILDAWLEYNFWNNFSIWLGQGKLPGNRERVISSGDLQFVDRSRLNSRFNIDRDMGIMLKHHWKIGENFTIKEVVAFSQGEGRDIIVGPNEGYCYTFRGEILPFGSFKSKGDYVGAAINREEKPKLALGFTYDINQNSVRERGQLGNFIYNNDGSYNGKTLNTMFADLMFKWQGLSIMWEYANKKTADGDPNVYDNVDSSVVGTHYTGTAMNTQIGWMFKNNWEVAARYTQIDNTAGTTSGGGSDESEITLGVSKYIVGHKLKVQTDISYRNKRKKGDLSANRGSNDDLYWRFQIDIHF